MLRRWIAAIALAVIVAGCATGDGTDWWQKGGDPTKRGPMRGSGATGG